MKAFDIFKISNFQANRDTYTFFASDFTIAAKNKTHKQVWVYDRD